MELAAAAGSAHRFMPDLRGPRLTNSVSLGVDACAPPAPLPPFLSTSLPQLSHIVVRNGQKDSGNQIWKEPSVGEGSGQGLLFLFLFS